MTTTQDIVAKLWNLCHVLRDDGVNYSDYVSELTYLLFLKMLHETGEERQLPAGYRWGDLSSKTGLDQFNFYRELLVHLGAHGSPRVQAVFVNAQTSLQHARHLAKLVSDIDQLDWYTARQEGLGDMYEGLLEKNASETKTGAGQYFTPRPLIECMVRLVQPKAGEVIQDPAAGTGGFLITADRYIKDHTNGLFDLTEKQQEFQLKRAYHAMELVPRTHRLLLMNAMLHAFDGQLDMGNTLAPEGAALPAADLVLTNPPFGTKKGGGGPTRDDFTFPTSNKQLAFLQHIHRNLKPGGRAAVVLPDNVLFEDGVGQKVRADLMDKCDLHTVLRLPTGIFYAQGVKTNVLFFTKGKAKDTGNTKAVWVYDLRANMPAFGKRTPLTLDHFKEFMAAFGDDPLGGAKRKDEGEEGRFRRFTREEIAKRSDNLDLAWLRDEEDDDGELPEPEVIAAEIRERLASALEEIDAVLGELEPEGADA